MTESDTPRRDTISVLSESSPIRLGLALIMIAGVIGLWNQVNSIRDDFRREVAAIVKESVTRDYLAVQVESLRREIELLRRDVSDLKASVAVGQQPIKSR